MFGQAATQAAQEKAPHRVCENGNASRIRKSRIRKTAANGGTSRIRKGATPRSRKWQRKPHKKSHGAGIFASGKATDGEWEKKFIVVWIGGGAKRIRKTAVNGSASSIRKDGTPRSLKW